MRRNPNQPLTDEEQLERILGLSEQRESQVDMEIRKVIHKNRQTVLHQVENRLEFVASPDGVDLIPRSIRELTYNLDDDGQMISGRMTNLHGCKFGCIVRTVNVCRVCRGMICRKHSLKVGRRLFCRHGLCLWAGRIFQVAYAFFRLGRFSVRSILGMDSAKSEEEILSEEEFFGVRRDDE